MRMYESLRTLRPLFFVLIVDFLLSSSTLETNSSMDSGWLFALFLLSQTLPFSSQEQSKWSVAACPPKFSCGNFSLEFPFTNLQNYNCGLCMMDCKYTNSFPKISLTYPVDQWFLAESIWDSNMTLYSEYLHSLLTKRSCTSFYYDIKLPSSPSISFTLLNSVTLFRCQKNQKNQNYNDSFLGNGYAYYGECYQDFIYYPKYPNSSSPPAVPISPFCTAVYLPVNESFLKDNNKSEDVPEVFRLLGAEFDLEWHVSEECYESHGRGGHCQTEWPKEARDENRVGTGNQKMGHIFTLGILGIGAAIGSMSLLAGVFIYYYKFKKLGDAFTLIMGMNTTIDGNLETFIRQYRSLAPKRFSYSDIKKITNSFENELGQGGYATVYKGKLSGDHLVAVKILKGANGNDQDFINEVLSISRTSHVNIVKLLGFCIQGRRRALVYEYMAHGSLEKYIFAQGNSEISCHLGMEKLYLISLGVARGLEYLHRGCSTRILHFDIKPHNILLDEDFCPKISDFGLAKQCTNKDSVVSILGVRGTIGYIAPEQVSRCFGVVSYKSDVYSYGMMILEIVGRRKNVNLKTSHASQIFFPEWAYQHMIIDKDLRLNGVVSSEEDEIGRKIILVGLWCIQKDPSERPTMSKVIEMLESNLEALPIPPKPFFDCSPSASSQSSSDNVSEFKSISPNS